MNYNTKDVYLERAKSNNRFEEYPLVVQPNAVVITDSGSNLRMTPLATFFPTASSGNSQSSSWASSSLSSSVSQTASYVSANNVDGTVSSSSFSSTASYVPNLYPVTTVPSSSWASQSLSSSVSQTSSLSVSASFLIGYTVPTTVTSSLTASFVTASGVVGYVSNAFNANSASYVPNLYPVSSVPSASWASQSLNSTYSISASWVSASVRITTSDTASYVVTSQTASFVTASNVIGYVASTFNANSASIALQANSASYVPNLYPVTTVPSSSWASQSLNSINSVSSSWVSASVKITTSDTASFVTASNIVGYVLNSFNANSASFTTQSLNSNSASWVSASVRITTSDTASFVTASNVIGYVLNAFKANTSSFATQSLNSNSASWVSASVRITTADTASYVITAQTASFVTASNVIGYVSNALNSNTASFITASNVKGVVSNASSASYLSGSGIATVGGLNSNSKLSINGTSIVGINNNGDFSDSVVSNFQIGTLSNPATVVLPGQSYLYFYDDHSNGSYIHENYGLHLVGPGDNASLHAIWSDCNLAVGYAGNEGFDFGATNNLLVAGNVGIQTLSPQFALDVAGTINTEYLQTHNAAAVQAQFGDVYPFYLISNSPNLGFNAYYNAGWKYGAGSSNAYGSIISFDQGGGILNVSITPNAGNDGDTADFNNNVLIITKDGRMGINISPDYTLDVNGDINFYGSITKNNSPFIPDNATTASVQSSGYTIPVMMAGSASVSSASSKIITFSKNMPNTSYVVSLTGESAITTPSVGGKTTHGFTASFSLYTGNIDWIAMSATQ